MKCRPENLLLFYASMQGHDEYIINRTGECILNGVDWEYLHHAAESYGVTVGLLRRLSQAGITDNPFIDRMQEIASNEIRRSASMISLYKEISSLLSKNGFRYMPLKGCDPRISGGSRKVCNVMEDIDVLVRVSDVEDIGNVLEKSGYHYQGSFSASHMNFFTDEAIPRLIEIHWDLINRTNPIHKRLFQPSLDALWERSITVCGKSLLSPEDLLSYSTAHCVKEYFHKPKWLTDTAWMIEHCSGEMDPATSKRIISEWGTARALGIIAGALKFLVCDSAFDAIWDLGAREPGIIGGYVARRLVWYEKLRNLRPLIFFISAASLPRALTVSVGMFERYIGKKFCKMCFIYFIMLLIFLYL